MPVRSQISALLVLVLLPACAGQPRGEEAPSLRPAPPTPSAPEVTTAASGELPAPEVAEPAPAAEPDEPAPVRRELLAPAGGDGLIVSRAGGIVLLDAQLRPLAVLSRERGRFLRVVGEELYFFALKQPLLRALDLSSGETRTVAELPRLKNPCYGAGPPADPIDFVQSEADLTIAGGALCLDIMDRDADQASQTRNYRVELATGAVEQRVVAQLGGDVCGKTREREQPRLCTPAPRGGVLEQVGPGGRWSYYPDSLRGQATDTEYALARVVDRAQRRSYAVVGRKLRPLRGGGNPVGACLVPPEASATWLGRSDVLVLEGCRDRLTIVRPPDRVEHLAVDGFAVVPN